MKVTAALASELGMTSALLAARLTNDLSGGWARLVRPGPGKGKDREWTDREVLAVAVASVCSDMDTAATDRLIAEVVFNRSVRPEFVHCDHPGGVRSWYRPRWELMDLPGVIPT